MENLFKNKKLFFALTLLSAAILILAFPKFNIFPLAWVALVPFIIVLHGITPGKGFWYGISFGIVFSMSLFIWVYPVAVEGWIFASIFYALPFGVFGAVAAYFYKNTESTDYLKRLIFIPSAYVLIAEYLKALKPMGMTCGVLAISQYKFLPIMQISDIFGVFGVSWLIVLFNAYLAEIIIMYGVRPSGCVRPDPQKKLDLVIPPLIVILCLFYGFYKLSANYKTGEPFKISIVQPNINQDVKWDRSYFDETLNKLSALTEKAVPEKPGLEKPSLVIWPETALPDVLLLNYNLSSTINTFVNNNRINLLTGSLDFYGNKLYNSAFLIVPDNFVKEKYDKMHLFPMGEYNPLKDILPHFKELDRIGKYSIGKKHTVFDVESRKFSTLICLESIFSYLSRDAVLKGAQFLVTITNDAWFGRTNAAEQHLALSAARAIENRVYMVFAANTGYSAFIDPCGRIYKVSNLFEDAVLTDYIYMANKRSIFTRFGEWFIIICLIITVSGIWHCKNCKIMKK